MDFSAFPKSLTFNQKIEGPNRNQVAKMRRQHAAYATVSAFAAVVGNNETAFNADCAAWDIEIIFEEYGYAL